MRKSRQGGFTLVELMIVIAIIGIIAGIGGTALLSILPNMRLQSTARDIFSTMIRAKSEAIQRGENVTLHFDAAASNYSLFVDRGSGTPANDGNQLIDPGEPVLIAATPLPVGVAFDPTVSGDGISFADNTLIFTQRGIPVGAGAAALRATDAAGNVIRQRTVVVSFAGRINME